LGGEVVNAETSRPLLSFVVLTHTAWLDPYVGVYLAPSPALERHSRVQSAVVSERMSYDDACAFARREARRLGVGDEHYIIMDAAIFAPKMVEDRVWVKS
jgi:hypothetical protein